VRSDKPEEKQSSLEVRGFSIQCPRPNGAPVFPHVVRGPLKCFDMMSCIVYMVFGYMCTQSPKKLLWDKKSTFFKKITPLHVLLSKSKNDPPFNLKVKNDPHPLP